MNYQRLFAMSMLIIFLSSCAPAVTTSTNAPSSAASGTPAPSETPTFTPTLLPTPTLAPLDEFMKGLVFFPSPPGGNQRPEIDWALENLVLPTGANWVRLHLACDQDDVHSTVVYCKQPETMTDEEYLHFVKTAHELGLRVMSEHRLETVYWQGYWAGDIGKFYTEEEWAAWFESYGKMILRYARLAEKAGTDYFIMVSELDGTAMREKEWRALIAQVRQLYHGKVSMAFSEEAPLQQAQFWDALDSINIHPYYLDLPGVKDPSVEQLKKAFAPEAERLHALSEKWGKPILISEIGYWSVDTMTQDYNHLDSSNIIDLQEQTDLFQAMFETFYGKDWVEGIFCYAYEGASNFAEPWNIHNDYLGKPAENVIRSFYGAPPMATPTLVTPPEADLANVEVIYADSLNPNWGNYPPDGPGSVQFDQSAVAVSGNAIRVDYLQWWSLDFRNDAVDWSQYQWLEFDMFVDPAKVPKVYTVSVLLRDDSYQPAVFKIELLQSQFIEGGGIQPGTWQHVQIPLDVFGPFLSHYVHISIERPGTGYDNTPLVTYIDNVVLRGK